MKAVPGALWAMVLTLLLPPSLAGGQDTPEPEMGLHMAALTGDVEAVRRHVRAGSDLNEKDPYGSTPLIIATTFGRAEVARVLLEGGADPDLTNNDRGTALHTAAFLGRPEIVRILLEHGADRYLRDNSGNTPLQSISAPFEDVQGIYDRIAQGLAPLGLRLDYHSIEATRPGISEMLRPRPEELAAVDYTPLPGGDWEVSTPSAEGLDPELVAELYLEASRLERLYGLLVIKNGNLIAEGYFNEGAIDQKALLQSVTKSYTSAMVGIALERGCLTDVDQPMLDFFPELASGITDPRKQEITLRHLLQMRAGYPWEETDQTYWDALLYGAFLPLIEDFPLTSDPGTEFQYSNLSSHLLGIIVARACGADLRSFGEEHLFTPLGAEAGEWIQDRDGYYIGLGELRFTARDAAKFGLLYLDDGVFDGKRIVPADWVRESHQRYSEGLYDDRWMGDESNYLGPYVRDVGYGYQWWSARAGEHSFPYAWGHGGQFIVLLEDLDMVVVVTSDPFYQQHDDESWRHERANLSLIGKFIHSLPGG